MSSALRRGGGALLGGLFLGLLLGAPAWAAPRTAGQARSCNVTSGPVALLGTDAGGATTDFPLAVEESEILATGTAPAGFSPPQAGTAYLALVLLPVGNVALQIPASAAMLETSGRTLVPALTADPFGADWFFAVPDTMTTATLSVGPADVTTEATGDSYATAPVSIGLHCSAFRATGSNLSPPGRSHGAGGAVPLGVFLGALAVAAAAVGAAQVRKRRAFARAHTQGRLRFVAAPLGVEPSGVPTGRSIVVKILGWLEFVGISTSTEHIPGPVKELAVYLVLNRGRAFTSLELVDEIWCIGRKPVTSHTIRTYVHQFRKTFGAGVLVTEGFTYVLTDVVGCDLDDYRTAASEPDQPGGVLRALALVRGPVLHGCFVKAKNAPFAWAERTAIDIEIEITHLAQQTTEQLLAASVPQDADAACAAGLRAQPSNLALRLLDLQVGHELGGQSELARRLRVARAALAEFPSDLARLERRAQELGFEGVTQR